MCRMFVLCCFCLIACWCLNIKFTLTNVYDCSWREFPLPTPLQPNSQMSVQRLASGLGPESQGSRKIGGTTSSSLLCVWCRTSAGLDQTLTHLQFQPRSPVQCHQSSSSGRNTPISSSSGARCRHGSNSCHRGSSGAPSPWCSSHRSPASPHSHRISWAHLFTYPPLHSLQR